MNLSKTDEPRKGPTEQAKFVSKDPKRGKHFVEARPNETDLVLGKLWDNLWLQIDSIAHVGHSSDSIDMDSIQYRCESSVQRLLCEIEDVLSNHQTNVRDGDSRVQHDSSHVDDVATYVASMHRSASVERHCWLFYTMFGDTRCDGLWYTVHNHIPFHVYSHCPRLTSEYQYVFLGGWNLVPIRGAWLLHVFNAVEEHNLSEFWIRAALDPCSDAGRGNTSFPLWCHGLYALGNPLFNEFLKEVWNSKKYAQTLVKENENEPLFCCQCLGAFHFDMSYSLNACHFNISDLPILVSCLVDAITPALVSVAVFP